MTAPPDDTTTDLHAVIATLRAERDAAVARQAVRDSDYTERVAYQGATVDVLRAMAASPCDPKPVFEVIVRRARDLCDAYSASLAQVVDSSIVLRAYVIADEAEAKEHEANFPRPIAADTMFGRAILAREPVQLPDVAADQMYALREGTLRGAVRAQAAIPLMRDGESLGAINITRRHTGEFSQAQIELLQTFAEQAVIAITSAETFRKLHEALEQQTATAEVLQVINSSPGDLTPVFDAMLEKAMRLCGAAYGVLRSFDGESAHLLASRGVPSEYAGFLARNAALGTPPAGTDFMRALQTGQPTQTMDVRESVGYRNEAAGGRAIADLGGARTVLHVPLVKDLIAVGLFTMYRQEVRSFSDKQIALLQNFAAQAVIAMENARLITETREALEQQTATAEVLQVINSSPGNLTPVFDAILQRAMALCEADYGHIHTWDGQRFDCVAIQGNPEFVSWRRRRGPVQLGPGTSPLKRLMEGESVVHVADALQEQGYRTNPRFRELVDASGIRSTVAVALRKEFALHGAIIVYRREVRPFSNKQISLLQNFAAQAVIAMENARLITETREALEQQTATAEVLQVINSSPGNLTPVFEAIATAAAPLCDAANCGVFRFDGSLIHLSAQYGLTGHQLDTLRNTFPLPPGRGSITARAIMTRQVVHVPDSTADAEFAHPSLVAAGLRGGASVPMLREGVPIGAITVTRQESRSFSDKQIALLENFATQAVIATENARLLSELRERTDQVAELNRGLEARVAEQVEELGRVGRLKRFLAPQLAELIVSQGNEQILESHRREIVVVFCDLRGYTAFTETAEPEEVLDFLREYHGALGPLVAQFEGTLDQFSGDGIMVFFNDPVPIPDPAVRAVKMAMAMREGASALVSGWRRLGRNLGFGAGIAQGYATLGQIGFSERSGYTAIGTVCNVAARLCAEAKDGQILISQRVAARLNENIALEDIGALTLKGLTQPVMAYNVPLAANQPALRVIDGGPQSV